MTAQATTRATAPPPPAAANSQAPAFRGFRSPNYTQVPDELFDELLPQLSGAELKVLLFVVRRTFGFKRDRDRISLAQMLHGIRTRDGRTLHRGVGLSKPTLLAALRSLQTRGVLVAARQRSAAKGDEPTVYALRFAGRDRPDDPPEPDAPERVERIEGATADGAPSEVPLVGKPDQGVGKKVDQGGGQAASPGGWAKNLTTQHTGPRQTARDKHHHPHPPSPTPVPEPEEHTLAPTNPDGEASTGAVDDDALLELLISRGITRRIARQLVGTFPAAAIREQLAWQPYRPAATNPAGALVEAIREGWPAPPAWLDAQEHAAAVARQAEDDARRQAEEEAHRREWAAKPPEERVAGRLQFWIQKQRIKGGREPTEAEVAARRAELLAELVDAAAPAAAAPVGVSLQAEGA